MGYEDSLEKGTSSTPVKVSSRMTLKKAVDFGEYDPNYLSTFPEWTTLSKYIRFQYIRTAIENRRKMFLMQYAEVNNILDFRLKPELKVALRNIERELKKVEDDREKILIEYSK